ncbi:MAG: Na+/H+ antiporter subunit E [Cystobacter sp.]
MPNARAHRVLWVRRSLWGLPRLLLVSLLWVALVEDRPRGLLLGMLAVPLTVWASFALEQPERPRAHPVRLGFFLFFCGGLVLRAGFDIAWRVLGPRREARPGLCVTRDRLPRGPARQFLHRVVSLVPGLLWVESAEDRLTLHLLDTSPGAKAAALTWVRELEQRVARVYGLIPPPRGLS